MSRRWGLRVPSPVEQLAYRYRRVSCENAQLRQANSALRQTNILLSQVVVDQDADLQQARAALAARTPTDA